MADYRIKETLDFAEKILLGMGQSTKDKRDAAVIALYRGIMFLSPATLSSAIRVLNSRTSGKELTDAGREFLLTIRREVDAAPIDEDGINQLWRSILDLPQSEWQRKGK